MILIAGGTGRLGSVLAARLTGRGLEVRVLTRVPARADHLAALVMDRADFSFDATAIRQAYPSISCTPLSMCLAQ